MTPGIQGSARPPAEERNDYDCVKQITQQDGDQQPLSKLLPDLLTGALTATLVTEQQFLIGSGEAEVNNGGQVLRFARIHSANTLVVPGSSLKGCVRTYAEALSPSCIPVGARQCGRCPACTIFGSTSHQARFGFEDARFAAQPKPDQIVQRWEPRRQCNDRKFYFFDLPNPISNDKETLEFVPAGTKIECSARFINLADWELGLVLLAMGLGKDGLGFSLKMGGAKNRKKGKVRFGRASVKVTLDPDLRTKVFGGKAAEPPTIDDCIDSYMDEFKSINTQIMQNLERLKKGAP